MSRLVIISNRLPFSVDREGEKLTLRPSSGGLVSAIKSYFEKGSSSRFTERLWAGVADFTADEWNSMNGEKSSYPGFQIVPIFIKKEAYDAYYFGFSNSVIWPLFHYFPNLVEYKTDFFNAYWQVNFEIAASVFPLLQPGDQVWIHDYQLMLLPQFLRSKDKSLSLGFFLHIPFPSYEVFRLLPSKWKKALLTGVMGADLIGFHTYDYVQHFIQSVKIILGVDNYFRDIQFLDRLVRVDLFPIGIDYQKFNSVASDPQVQEKSRAFKKSLDGKKIVFSVDRLDYSKGIGQRLSAIEYFLDTYPSWREKLVFILNMVPSRDGIPAYMDGKKKIEEYVGLVNGKFSTIVWQPVLYRYQHLSFTELTALYLAADAALITPLRDGMNLVAKEYVASRSDQGGVLILSDLAGAASELSESLRVNPLDLADVAAAIDTALSMPKEEQIERMQSMQNRLQEYDVQRWVDDFLDQLDHIKRDQQRLQVKLLSEKIASVILRNYQDARLRCLMLDYDGTLVPFAARPALAFPEEKLLDLLSKLAGNPRNEIVIISGRDSDSLENWFGSMPITLVAGHGASFKLRGGQWQQLVNLPSDWKEQVRPILRHFVTRCSGSFIEEKANTLVWHYRNVEARLGFIRSREMLNHLTQYVQNTPLQVLDGSKTVEIRIAGQDKGTIALKIIEEYGPDFIMCMGDDVTDEDMFKAVGSRANTIKVGTGTTLARHTLLSQSQVLPFLSQFAVPINQFQHAGS